MGVSDCAGVVEQTMAARDLATLLLFDVDGTITEARQVYWILFTIKNGGVEILPCVQVISPEMKHFMAKVRERYVVGLVGGSDLDKVQEQMGGDNGQCNRSQSIRLHALLGEGSNLV